MLLLTVQIRRPMTSLLYELVSFKRSLLVVAAIAVLVIHSRNRQPTEAMQIMAKEYQHHSSPPKDMSVTEETRFLLSQRTKVSHVHEGGRSLRPALDAKLCIEFKQVATGPDLLETSRQCLDQVVNIGCVTGVPFFIRQYQDRGEWYVFCDCECGK